VALSARNQLAGKVKDIRLGDIMAHVVVKVGGSLIESVITRSSAEELKLKKGDAVRVVVKSTEVMIQKARERGPGLHVAARASTVQNQARRAIWA
jgi:molybdopterin-binding protein